MQVNTREDEFLMRLNDAFLSCDMPVELQDFLENNVEKLYRDYDFDDPYDNEIFGNKVAQISDMIEQQKSIETPDAAKFLKRVLLTLRTKY